MKSAFAVTSEAEIFVPLEGIIDTVKELDRLDKQIKKLTKELEAKEKKLSNRGFLEKAKKEIVEEQMRLRDDIVFRLERLKKAKELMQG